MLKMVFKCQENSFLKEVGLTGDILVFYLHTYFFKMYFYNCSSNFSFPLSYRKLAEIK